MAPLFHVRSFIYVPCDHSYLSAAGLWWCVHLQAMTKTLHLNWSCSCILQSVDLQCSSLTSPHSPTFTRMLLGQFRKGACLWCLIKSSFFCCLTYWCLLLGLLILNCLCRIWDWVQLCSKVSAPQWSGYLLNSVFTVLTIVHLWFTQVRKESLRM